jgi:hypothetical protein
MTMHPPFPHGKLPKIFPDVSRKTLFLWARLGLFEWAGEERDSRGIKRLYSLFNLCQVGLVRKLAGLNTPLDMIMLIMDKYFLDHIQRPALLPKLPGESSELPSKTDVMTKCLILSEDKRKRGWVGKSVSGFALREFSQVGKYIKTNPDLTTFIVVNLPAIVKDVHASIKEAGLE